jgi:hypothetical protein
VPINTVADNDVLTASFWNTNVRDQVVSTTTSGALPGGTEGQMVYETDNNRYQAYNGAFMEFGRLSGNTTWVPQIDQGASTNITKTINTAMYIRIGNFVIAWFDLTLTAAGTAGSAVTITFPVNQSGHATSNGIGSAALLDASTAANCGPGTISVNSASQVFFRFGGVTSGGWGGSPNFALASGDSMRGSMMYLVA